MGKQFDHILKRHKDFISQQVIFFVSTSAPGAKINLSPKGIDSFRIINENKIVWLNLTGSGNETAAHLMQDDRMTIMFCSFSKKPQILRLYGHAKCLYKGDPQYKEHLSLFPDLPGVRQLIEMNVTMVQTSCGFGVPIMEFKSERPLMKKWAEEKGEEGLINYRREKNSFSLDGFEIKRY